MQVILLDKIAKLGGLGDQVAVKAGYARNYLIPQGKAVMATKANIETFDARRAELVAILAAGKAAAEERAAKLGANAVVGIDLDYEVLGQDNGMLMVSASGTAVVVE